MRWLAPWVFLIGLSYPTLGQGVPAATEEGFSVPQPGHVLEFPRDHGSHPDFKIEWWYLTGHLETAAGRQLGYQATFFRSALTPPEERDSEPATPGFGGDQLYLGHMALTDISGGQFYHQERLRREGWDATAATERLDLRLSNWTLEQAAGSDALELRFSIGGEVAADLRLRPQKPLIVFGEDGTSRKGAEPTARSYYLSWTRLATEGSVRIGDEERRVTGSSWMDHEIASRQLGEELAGWDWTAIQLEDGWEIKAYILRQADGTPSPFSALIWIAPDGGLSYRGPAAFQWERVDWWESPETGHRYPTAVNITTSDPRDGRQRTLRLRPLLAEQELRGGSAGLAYWEGACAVHEGAGEAIGRAYLELVGYGGDAGSGLR